MMLHVAKRYFPKDMYAAVKASWLAEVEEMRTRILAMRQELVKVL